MKKIHVFVISTILMVLVFLSSVYYRQQQNKQKNHQNNKKTIVTTTNMLYDLTQHILYDEFDKNNNPKETEKKKIIDSLLELKKPMMGVGVDPHNYKPLPNHRLIILQSDLIVINGLHLEANMEKAFQLFISKEKPDQLLFNVGEALKKNPKNTIIQHDGVDDPHIWFNYKLWMEAGKLLKTEIQKLIENAEATDDTKTQAKQILETNFKDYKDEVMKKIGPAIIELQKNIPENKRYLVTSHDAFSYFGETTGLNIEAIQGTSTQTEASIGDIRRIAQNIKDKQIKAIFTESSMTNNTLQSLKEMVEKDGYQIKMCEGEEGLFSDSLNANLDYLLTFLHNIKIITKELKK
ncbi:metal ABC transporter solute-binding protein, Zn/Mn family [Candidatus Phytoplasma pruni]|uniref:Zinc ABC transporter substrate-binding protein n=1 Tax=Candidatus Phytoplasma pruni TaxID=479893 RepID=A0A851HKH2_9MOLU|nr:zinc ABC transporter substrate-binding protein [Candidatus Phytoplasma pruni]NWN46006.1 zinc ABC transporter substrate-binding protein [Candidatus Phytoplasma pruni]